MFQQIKKMFVAGLSAFIIVSTPVQAITPSPQMIEQFKQLPKSEQQRIAKQYGIDPSVLSGGSVQNAPVSSPEVVTQRQAEQEIEDADKKAKQVNFTEDNQKHELKRFGYDMFAGEPSTFAPVSDVPVPNDYRVGPGDSINVQLHGKENNEFTLTINREGVIQFPELGPITTNGLSFSELREEIQQRVKQQKIGIEASVSMGELRSIRIFVAGDAYRSGSYTVSSLSTVTQALFVAGGVNEIGSLRNIQVKRSGKLVGSFDLYDLLLRGDASGDISLRSGDVVFIPSVGGLVTVSGEVRRPAIYELKKGETIADMVHMAAGVTSDAYAKSTSVERYNKNGLKSIVNVDLTSAKGKQVAAKSGDFIRVKNASIQYEDAITVVGAVVRPGRYQWQAGQKVSDIVPSIWGDLSASADLDYALLVREKNKYGDIDVYQFAIGKALTEPHSAENLTIEPRDKIVVFNYNDKTQNRYELNRLVKDRVAKVASLKGEGLVSNDAFESGFNALNDSLENRYKTSIAGVAITGALEQKDNLVRDEVEKMLVNLFHDKELIKLSTSMKRSELLYPILNRLAAQKASIDGIDLVAIAGKVRHPGVYPLTQNANIEDLIKAGGGLLEGAYTEHAELTRSNNTSEIASIMHEHVNLNGVLHGLPEHNINLKSRDMLTVLTTPEWQERKIVEIRGEVKFPGTYNIRRGEKLSDVIKRAGGFTDYAFPSASVFVRDSIKNQEQLEIKKLADQLRRDIATRGVSKDGTVVNYADAQLMLDDLENIEAVGRLVVDLNAINLGIPEADIQLEHSDILYVPTLKQTVAVMGEVQHQATHRYKQGLTLDNYLDMSGGPRERGDDGRIYIIKADGSVALPTASLWFNSKVQIEAGDTIIVPLDTEYKDNLTLWTQVTQIIYNSAVALATISGL
ncbi:SLBB domain-containing protein [Shewanella gaetbuli]|uniref:SLBB domain-containing protein n=1 Tax=Shewanella gaetbuli TaxID=220752 RepID=A0A9X1ZP77_9GAMM|nr:SLBB domain-containing protein [Shewanella gaetbuli]